jgi:uncharacterized protein (DUF1015 family)
MADVRPFRGVRPLPNLAEKVAAPPYDVLDSDEARILAKNNPYTFLHINKPEIDLPPDVDLYDPRVYQKGAENLRRFLKEGIIVQDPAPYYYVYQQIMGDHKQVGVVACASVEEYEKDLIKKHEFTRPDKEDDRVRHIDAQNAQVGPVFLTYPAQEEIDAIVASVIKQKPVYDFTADDGVQHTLWVVDNPETITRLRNAFAKLPALYVADGHHRSAAAMRVKQMRQKANPNHTGEEEYNFFLSVIFPHNQMQILDYNRVVKDLNGMSASEFLEKVARKFEITPMGENQRYKPERAHTFGMYFGGKWYKLEALPGTFDENDPVKRLDVSILQENLLGPILGIADPRKDKRIDFIGGIRGLAALEKRVKDGWAVAFAMYPTSIEDLMAIADAGKVMPPKSTWFEPKLRTGLVIHLLD